MIIREDRKSLHRFLLRTKRRDFDLWEDTLELAGILKPYGCRVTPWEHPILFETGIDIFISKTSFNLKLIPTKKGYRVFSLELDGLQKSLMEIVCQIQKS